MDNLEAGKLTEYCELLNNITNLPENKKCFDCVDDTSPRYLCATFLTFVCSCCASVHQEFGHKIKVLSVFGFTTNEIDVLKETGNRVATDKWLARWNPEQFDEPDPTSPSYKEDARNYMRAKYIEKKWVKPLPPPLPIGEAITRKAAEGTPRRNSDVDISPREGAGADADPETDTSSLLRHRGGGSGYSSTEVSPRGQVGQQTEEVSPRRYVSASPKRYSMEVSPSKRYSTEVSPRGYSEAEAMYEEAFKQQQHDVIKPTFNPFLSDPFPAATPSVVYVPQPFLLPMSFPPSQYGYPQYPMPMDMNQFPPPYYSRPTIPFQPYPYDTIQASNAAMPTSWADVDVIKLRQQQQQQHTHTHTHTHTQRMHQSSCKELPRIPSEDMPLPHPPVLRSASDNSLATTMRLAAEDAAANECNCKLINSTNSSTVTTPSRTGASEQSVSKTELNKQKIQGLVNKMTGLLKRSQN